MPHYAHLLIDQTRVGPEELRGELHGRIAQLAMMAAYRASWAPLQRLVPLLAELGHAGRNDDLEQIVEYIATTVREPERWRRFSDAASRVVPGGAELMNKTEQMLEIYGEVVKDEAQQEWREKGRKEGRREGRREGELITQVRTIEGLMGRDVPWSTIEAATGIDEAAFRRLKHQLETRTTAPLRRSGGSPPRPADRMP